VHQESCRALLNAPMKTMSGSTSLQVSLFIHMNACWAPRLEASPEHFTVAAAALSSLRLLSSRMPLWMSDSFTQPVFWISTEVVTKLFGFAHGWCHVKLLPFRRKFCVHHATMHQFTVSLIQNHIRRMHICLSVNCYLYNMQNNWDLVCANAVTRGAMYTK